MLRQWFTGPIRRRWFRRLLCWYFGHVRMDRIDGRPGLRCARPRDFVEGFVCPCCGHAYCPLPRVEILHS